MFENVLSDILNGYTIEELNNKYPNLVEIMGEKDFKWITLTNSFQNNKGCKIQLSDTGAKELEYGIFSSKCRDIKYKYAYALLLLGYDRDFISSLISKYKNRENRLKYLDNLMNLYGFSLREDTYYDEKNKKFICETRDSIMVNILLNKHEESKSIEEKCLANILSGIKEIQELKSVLEKHDYVLNTYNNQILNMFNQISINTNPNKVEIADNVKKLLDNLNQLNLTISHPMANLPVETNDINIDNSKNIISPIIVGKQDISDVKRDGNEIITHISSNEDSNFKKSIKIDIEDDWEDDDIL